MTEQPTTLRPPSPDISSDPFRIMDHMRANGWKVAIDLTPPGKLGHGCITITVERDGRKGRGVAEKIGVALDRAVRRHSREI